MSRKVALSFVALLAIGFATPASAQFGKPSKDQQIKLGQQAATELRTKEKLLPSYDDRVKILRKVANKLIAAMDDHGDTWQFSFDVIDNKEVNAFALPGGPTFFFSGLM